MRKQQVLWITSGMAQTYEVRCAVRFSPCLEEELISRLIHEVVRIVEAPGTRG